MLKILKLHWLKRPETVPQKRNLDQKINYSYLKFIFYFRFFSTSFHNTVSLKKRRSFYDPQLTRHCKNDTPTTHRKTLLTLQVFQQTFLVSLRKKKLHYTISRTAFSKHFQSKCLYISVYLRKNIIVPKT